MKMNPYNNNSSFIYNNGFILKNQSMNFENNTVKDIFVVIACDAAILSSLYSDNVFYITHLFMSAM